MIRQGPRSGFRNVRPTRSEPSKVGEGREAVGSGTDGRRVGSSKGKRGSGKVREGFADARETGGGEEDVKTTIVVGGGGRDKNLGLGGKVVGGTMETMVGGERGVEGPGSEVVKGELGMWEQVVPAVRREGDVGGREDGNKMVLAVRIARSAGLERWLKGGTY